MIDLHNKVLLFTDGACSGNPGPGGYGGILSTPGEQTIEFGDADPSTTNNRMEMQAIIEGLEKAPVSADELVILTDSNYTIQGITQWIFGWKKKGWKTAAGADVSNKDLWLRLDEAVRKHKSRKIHWQLLPGHAGIPGNERCDEIAVSFSKNTSINLYHGPTENYLVELIDFKIPEKKKKKKSSSSKKAFSYLSYVHGKLQIHSNWKECEAVVKGVPGAKFKKSFSREDEDEIIASWGVRRPE